MTAMDASMMAALIVLAGVIFGPIVVQRVKPPKANGNDRGLDPDSAQSGKMSVEFWDNRFKSIEHEVASTRADIILAAKQIAKDGEMTRRLLRERLPPKGWWKNGNGNR